jgi:hypothetical protein
MAKAGLDRAGAKPDKMDKASRVAADLLNPNMPPETVEGQAATIAIEGGEQIYDSISKRKKRSAKQKAQPAASGWWGR